MKVLIIEDSKITRDVLIALFKSVEHEVVGEAESGRVGIELYKKLKPDVVILDISMPGMSGITCLNEIIKYDKQAKVIVCTAMISNSMREKALNVGAIDFIEKPFKMKEIIEKIEKIENMEWIPNNSHCYGN